jgi:hypothetical protein
LDIDHDVAAGEQDGDMGAQCLSEGGLGQTLVLRLTGEDQAAGLRHDRLQLLAGKENQERLDNPEEQRDKRRRDEGELDCGSAAVVAEKGSSAVWGGLGGHDAAPTA